MSHHKPTVERNYYGARYHYSRMSKQIGHKLCLAMTAEEDAYWWEKYKAVLDKWRALEKPSTVTHATDRPLRHAYFLRPEFNAEYVELTEQLKAANDKKSAAKTKQERRVINEEIRAIKQKRYTVTIFHDRETGEVVQPEIQSEVQPAV